MSMQNISVIFTPAIFHDHNQAENVGEWCTDKVLEDLIHHCDQVFGCDNNDDEKLAASLETQQQQHHQKTGCSSEIIPRSTT